MTSDGINVNPNDSIIVTSPGKGGTFIVMGLQFTATGAKTVTVTFIISNAPVAVIEVSLSFL